MGPLCGVSVLAPRVMSVYNKNEKVKSRAGTSSDPNLNFATHRGLVLKRQAFYCISQKPCDSKIIKMVSNQQHVVRCIGNNTSPLEFWESSVLC